MKACRLITRRARSWLGAEPFARRDSNYGRAFTVCTTEALISFPLASVSGGLAVVVEEVLLPTNRDQHQFITQSSDR